MLLIRRYRYRCTAELQLSSTGLQSLFAVLWAAACAVFAVYAALFLSVSVPFVREGSLIILIPGLLLAAWFILRLLLIVAAAAYSRGAVLRLQAKQVSFTVRSGGREYSVPPRHVRMIGNDFLIAEHEGRKRFFPLVLLSRADRRQLMPALTRVYLPGEWTAGKLRESAEVFVTALLIATHIMHYVVGNYTIPTPSMRDTLMEGDWVFAERLTLGLNVPRLPGMRGTPGRGWGRIRHVRRGDIVIFRHFAPGDREREYIKRCVAVAGDTVRIQDGRVVVNGVTLDEPYAVGRTDYRYHEAGSIDGVVPRGKLVLLGDNREDSRDGRYFGYVSERAVVARVLFLYWNRVQVSGLDFSRIGPVR